MGVYNRPKRNLCFVHLKGTKPGEDPVFMCKDSQTEGVTSGDTVAGIIKDIKPYQYEWPKESGKMVSGFKMEMVDKEGISSCSFSYTYTTRTIINCLATIEHPGKIYITVQKGKDNEYPSIYVSVDEENCKWQWKFKELEKLVDRSSGQGDYTKIDAFMDKVIIEKIRPMFAGSFEALSKELLGVDVTADNKDEILEEVEKQQQTQPQSESGDIKTKDINSNDEIPKTDAEDPGPEAIEEPPETPASTAHPDDMPQDDLPF